MSSTPLRILTVISALNLPRFTRRATIEAISKKVEQLDLLIYTGVKNRFKKKETTAGIPVNTYHFWVPDMLKKHPVLTSIEHKVRKSVWSQRFSNYEVIFFTDPNQACLLPYIDSQKIVYLIRDPNVLQHKKHYRNERALIDRADLILATSQNLATEYIPKYHQTTHPNIHYWPNTVDLEIWDYKRFENNSSEKGNYTVGMAGNMNDRTDLKLLDFITDLEQVSFELCGNIFESVDDKKRLNKILAKKNVAHLGYIPFDKLPEKVAGWQCGLTIEKKCEYTRFTHHNKIYQYLALGLPVVSLKIHDDYSHLEPYVQSVESYSEYINAIEIALEKSRDPQFKRECIAVAETNSADKRAEDFLKWVKDLMNE